jgi:hypothetical protein
VPAERCSFPPQRSLLTAARARQAAADWSSGTASGFRHWRAQQGKPCGLFTADLSRKGTCARIVAGSARKSWTTLISAAPLVNITERSITRHRAAGHRRTSRVRSRTRQHRGEVFCQGKEKPQAGREWRVSWGGGSE